MDESNEECGLNPHGYLGCNVRETLIRDCERPDYRMLLASAKDETERDLLGPELSGSVACLPNFAATVQTVRCMISPASGVGAIESRGAAMPNRLQSPRLSAIAPVSATSSARMARVHHRSSRRSIEERMPQLSLRRH